MIKRMLAVAVVAILGYAFYGVISEYREPDTLKGIAKQYAEQEPVELGAANLVTAVVVTYRGLDTLGEVSVLFVAAAGIALLLGGPRREEDDEVEPLSSRRAPGEILTTGVQLLLPLVVTFGVYIFLHGHLTPGGGFQGGAVIASAVLLMMLARPRHKVNHGLFTVVESLSGVAYVIIGVLGLVLAGGFLDSRFLPLGSFGTLLSAGAIPVIYTLIGLKVGTELAGVIDVLRSAESNWVPKSERSSESNAGGE